MKSNFFKVVFILFLALEPTKAMDDSQEETAGFLQVRPIQQRTHQEEILASAPDKTVFTFNFPNEILLTIFRFFAPHELGKVSQVSHQFKENSEDSALWRHVGLKHYEGFLSEEDLRENLKQTVIRHYLSVTVNLTEDLKKIGRLVRDYELNSYTPFFKRHLVFTKGLATTQEITVSSQGKQRGLTEFHLPTETSRPTQRDIEGIAEGNLAAIERKISGLLFGNFEFEMDWVKARELNDLLIEKGDLKAIHRKIRGLALGKYGYEKNPLAAKKLNELLVTKRDLKAIKRKLEGLIFGNYGYEVDWIQVKEFNELLADEGDAEAIKRKKWGFSFFVTIEEEDEVTSESRTFVPSTREDPITEQKFNDFLIEQGDPEAIRKKIQRLLRGNTIDHAAARELNEVLIKQGDLEATQQKIEGLLVGNYGYEIDVAASKELNEFLIKQGNIEATKRKIEGLLVGNYGYEIDVAAARELVHQFLMVPINKSHVLNQISGIENRWPGRKSDFATAKKLREFLVELGDISAIQQKIHRLLYGNYGYEIDTTEAKELNELLVKQGNLEAIQRKFEGLLYGEIGYEIDTARARELIHQFLAIEGSEKIIEERVKVLNINPKKARVLNEFLVEQGNLKAIERKIIAMSDARTYLIPCRGYGFGYTEAYRNVHMPTYGYEKDPVAAKEFNEFLVEQGNIEAIERKLKGLIGIAKETYSTADGPFTVDLTYGYEKDPLAAKKFIESLVFSDFPVIRAIGKYLKAFAMKYGVSVLGYEKDREQALIFIREHNIPY